MIIGIWLGVILSMPIIPGYGANTRATNKTADGLSRGLEGYWLNVQVIEKLYRTKSPSQSLAARYASGFVVTKEGGHYKWAQIFNFHEGTNFIIQEVRFDPSEPRHLTLQILPTENSTDTLVLDSLDQPKQIIWTHEENEPKGLDPLAVRLSHKDIYRRLDTDFEHFINHVVLEGSFKDASGRLYHFTPDQQAQWPQGQFSYRLLLDGVLGNDVFLQNDTLYKWIRGRLCLYHYRGALDEGNYSVDETPFVILVPQTSSISQ